MSISRAFTNRRVKQSMQAAEEERGGMMRINSARGPGASLRHKISSPIELVHTTNMLSYNAPDIVPMSASSVASSPRSDDDMSDGAITNGTTPPTSPDVDSPVKRSTSPEPNHLSSFFTTVPPRSQRQQEQEPPASASSSPSDQPPAIPQRATSHSKPPYNSLVRQRSASQVSQQSQQSQQSQRTVSPKASFSFSRSPSTSTSTSVSSSATNPMTAHKSKLSNVAASSAPSPSSAPFMPASPPRSPPRSRPVGPPPSRSASRSQQQQQQQQQPPSAKNLSALDSQQHPFGPELAQVSELAEEFGVKEQLAREQLPPPAASSRSRQRQNDGDEQEMLRKGLLKFSADEYLREVVQPLFASFMLPPPPARLAGMAPPPPPAPVPVVEAVGGGSWI
ncbi:hypothetical protein VTJ83DRAFT_2030 [Remersonia thermophila]|uniref:Uncharacterized protein n=1 Tax=Remersonia thermophila TaxID=72144 RepID=A0ABR4DHT1_9PEZI